jgi:hypothetical protein
VIAKKTHIVELEFSTDIFQSQTFSKSGLHMRVNIRESDFQQETFSNLPPLRQEELAETTKH